MLWAAPLAVAAGCGPIEYLGQVTGKASGAVAAAKAAGAERYAPYEMTAAESYLAKAQEEAGYAEYQVAIELGRKAEAMAVRARAKALEKEDKGRGAGPPASAAPPSPGVGGGAGAGSGAGEGGGAGADEVPR